PSLRRLLPTHFTMSQWRHTPRCPSGDPRGCGETRFEQAQHPQTPECQPPKGSNYTERAHHR
ncbi:hypothetical protein LSAT2_010845, partial [Lamellibrachia satsuma]